MRFMRVKLLWPSHTRNKSSSSKDNSGSVLDLPGGFGAPTRDVARSRQSKSCHDHEKRKVELTFEGRQRLRALPQDELVSGMGLVDQYEYSERAIKVERDFHLDQQYVIRDGEIVIVDEYTGRMAEGRKWRDGIHQAIEAKEQVEITVPTGQAARITVQDLFLRYEQLAGMTGTARTAAREFRKIYRHRVYQIPTNRPRIRSRLKARVYATTDQKLEAITAEVKQFHEQGRPVLIGTRTIEKSERLSALLAEAGIEASGEVAIAPCWAATSVRG